MPVGCVWHITQAHQTGCCPVSSSLQAASRHHFGTCFVKRGTAWQDALLLAEFDTFVTGNTNLAELQQALPAILKVILGAPSVCHLVGRQRFP